VKQVRRMAGGIKAGAVIAASEEVTGPLKLFLIILMEMSPSIF
jgi:hypothetical protein